MTSIEWVRNADGTLGRSWNPVSGCSRISPGCDHCYAEAIAKRFAGSKAFPDGFAVTLHPERLDQPLHRQKPTTWFVNSMSDLFHRDIPEQYVDDVFAVMATPHCIRHTFQILTKRPREMAEMLNRWVLTEGWQPLSNIWFGTSIENDRYTFRADWLRSTPAVVRFLSCEPLLGPLPSLDLAGIDWVIAGAESGPGARPMDEDWVRQLRDRCVALGVPFFYKQNADRRGHKLPLPELDGRVWDEMPKVAGQS